MPTTPLTASRYPASSDAPNGPQQIQNAVYDIEDNTIPYFTSTSARSTAYTAWVAAGGVMRNGLYCHVNGLGLCRYTTSGGGKWIEEQPPTLLGVVSNSIGWSNNSASIEQPFQYSRDHRGFVYLTGAITNTSTNYTPGTTITVATLPAGYRPSGWVNFQWTTSSVSDPYPIGDISTAGVIRVVRNAGGTVPSNTVHNINVMFPAA